MNNGFRIPTVLAFLLVGGVVAVLGIFSDDARILLGRAATPSTTIPQSVEIHHVTDTTATIFWKSTDIVASTIAIPSTSSTFYDVRDSDSIAKPYLLHMYTLHGLPAQKTTSFEIRTGNQTVYKGTVTTGPPLSKVPQAVPLYGTVPKDFTENYVFIQATINDEVSTMVYSTSPKNWALPLSTIRTKDLEEYYCESSCEDDTPIKLTFLTEEAKEEKTVTIAAARPFTSEEQEPGEEVLSSTSVLSPRPKADPPLAETIKLSPTASPSGTKKIVLAPTLKATKTPTRTPTPTVKKTVLAATQKADDVSITSPTDGQALSFAKPQIRGTGVSGRDVTISLSGQVTQIGKAKVTDKNIWQWVPAFPLTPGKYIVTIDSVDRNNKKVTKTQSFIVLKSGESVLSASTPSATLIPFPTEVPVPTPTTVIDIPTATPTMFVTAGPEVSIIFIGGGTLLLLFALALL